MAAEQDFKNQMKHLSSIVDINSITKSDACRKWINEYIYVAAEDQPNKAEQYLNSAITFVQLYQGFLHSVIYKNGGFDHVSETNFREVFNDRIDNPLPGEIKVVRNGDDVSSLCYACDNFKMIFRKDVTNVQRKEITNEKLRHLEYVYGERKIHSLPVGHTHNNP